MARGHGAQPLPDEDWEESTNKSLRIVVEALQQCVKVQQAEFHTAMARAEHGVPRNRANQAQHLLSGLVVFGDCGSPFAMRDARHYGCASVRSKGTCSNNLKVKRANLERLVGNAIRHRRTNEDAMARLRAEVIAERKKVLGSSNVAKVKLLAAVKRKEEQVTRLVCAITGAGHNPTLLAKLEKLQAEAHGSEMDLEALEAAGLPPPLEIPKTSMR